jgi:hypothetical protein
MADPTVVKTSIVPARDVDTKLDVRVALILLSDGTVRWEPAK